MSSSMYLNIGQIARPFANRKSMDPAQKWRNHAAREMGVLFASLRFFSFFLVPALLQIPPPAPPLTLVPAQAVRRTLCRPLTINSAVTSVTGLLLGPHFWGGTRVKQACRQLHSGLSGRHQRYDLGPMYPQRHVPPSTLSTGKRPRNLAYVVIHMWP